MGSSTMWTPFIPQSISGWEAICVDLPGHHKQYELPKEYSMGSFASHVLSQARFSEHDEIILIGHSMGGYIAADIAARYPQQILALILFHSKVSNDSETKRLDRARAIELSQENRPLYISTMLRNTVSTGSVHKMTSELEVLIHDAQAMISHECIKACHTAMMNRKDLLAEMEAAGIQRYYFLGLEDKAIPFSSIQDELKNVPKENIRLEEGIGHMGHIEAPESARRFLESSLRLCGLA